jgi:HTH-type transcriptional regulator, competence development regulator
MEQRQQSVRKKKQGPVTAEVAFGQILRERRLAKSMTQAELESESRIDRSYISQLENGQKQVCLKSIIQIAMKLGMQPGELVDETVRRMDRRELDKLL